MSALKLANIEGELSHLRQGILNYHDELEVLKVTLHEIQKRPSLEELKLDDEWPLLSGKKSSKIAALEVGKKLDTVSKNLHYVTQTLTETKKDVAEEKVKEDMKNKIIVCNIPDKELVLLMTNQNRINSSC